MAIGCSVLSLICIPYYYYAIRINTFGQQNKPEGFELTSLQDFWKTLVGAAVCHIVKEAIYFLFMPTMIRLSKFQDVKDDDEAMKLAQYKYAQKGCSCLYGFVYFSVSATWGWAVLS